MFYEVLPLSDPQYHVPQCQMNFMDWQTLPLQTFPLNAHSCQPASADTVTARGPRRGGDAWCRLLIPGSRRAGELCAAVLGRTWGQTERKPSQWLQGTWAPARTGSWRGFTREGGSNHSQSRGRGRNHTDLLAPTLRAPNAHNCTRTSGCFRERGVGPVSQTLITAPTV